MLVRESISFKRGLDPKSAMGVGLKGQLAKLLDGVQDYAAIGTIIEDTDLTIAEKNELITHLLKQSPEKYDFDENDLYWFGDHNLDYLAPLPEGASFVITMGINLVKKNGQFVAVFDDWSDWAELFATKDDISSEFIAGVLGGDAFQFFEADNHYLSTNDIIDFFKSNIKEITTYDYLEDLFTFKGGEEDRDNIKETISAIYKDPKFDELKSAIDNTLMDADQSARESEAYKQLKKSIIDHFEFGSELYNDNNDTYEVNTTKAGADKLIKVSNIGEDYIDYDPPRDDYWAEINPETFNEFLKSNLDLHVS